MGGEPETDDGVRIKALILLHIGSQQRVFKPDMRDNQICICLDAKTLQSWARYSQAISNPRSRVAAEFLQMLDPVMSQYADRMEELHRLGDLETFKKGLEAVSDRLRLILEGQGHEV